VPVFFSRGVIQISGYIDELLASLLPTGAFAALSYAQTLYLLPVSLFGMSVSAAELPAMSSAVGSASEVATYLRDRLNRGLQRISFFIIPSAVGFLLLGDVIIAAIYQTGVFGREEVLYVWAVLAGATVGLLAQTLGRLYASTFYALRDTRTPLRFALVHVTLTAVLGYLFSQQLPPWLGVSLRWGVVGLTVSAGIAAWAELLLLRRALNRRIGRTGLALGYALRLGAAALLAAGLGFIVKVKLPDLHPIIMAVLVLGLYGSGYLLLCWLAKIPEVTRGIAKARQKLGLQ